MYLDLICLDIYTWTQDKITEEEHHLCSDFIKNKIDMK